MEETTLSHSAVERERAIRFAIIIDAFMLAALFATAIASGSLTSLAETVRGTLGVLPRGHRLCYHMLGSSRPL